MNRKYHESLFQTGQDVDRQEPAHNLGAAFCDDDSACFDTSRGVHCVYVRPVFRYFLQFVLTLCIRSYARVVFTEPQFFGIGKPRQVRSFGESLNAMSSKRNRLVFVHNGFLGDAIERVISRVAQPAISRGIDVRILPTQDDMKEACRSSLRGVSSCIAAAVFDSSPTEGPHGRWDYTIRMDAVLGSQVDVRSGDNGAELHLFPFKHAIDWEIARSSGVIDQNALPKQVGISGPCLISKICTDLLASTCRSWSSRSLH